MSSMFTDASSFNGGISGWDVSNVKTVFRMFAGTDSFDADIWDWDLRKTSDDDMLFRYL